MALCAAFRQYRPTAATGGNCFRFFLTVLWRIRRRDFFSSNRCDSSLGLVDAGGIHHDSDWRCWLGVTSAHTEISLVWHCLRTSETDSSCERRESYGGYSLNTTGGPLTRFPFRSAVTSTRSAILMNGMPLFIPYCFLSKAMTPLIEPEPVPLPVT